MIDLSSIREQAKDKAASWKIDPKKGSTLSVVSSQWYSRPDDQRFVSMEDLFRHTLERSHASWTEVSDLRHYTAEGDDQTDNQLNIVSSNGVKLAPTHWAFAQLCAQVKAPAGYLRSLPSRISAIAVAYGLATYHREMAKLYSLNVEGRIPQLRALTSPTYGRIMDVEVVSSVIRNFSSDWKVPGTIDWKTGQYSPDIVVDKKSTTLFSSDRDVFVFLVNDKNPIQIGTLADGSPDYLFPGFIASNSEVGSRVFSYETMFLRGVCQNRNLWGVEHHKKWSIKHSKHAPTRFTGEAAKRMEEFANESASKVIEKVQTAKAIPIAKTDDERISFFMKMGLSKNTSKAIVEEHISSEGRPPESLWDMTQGLTAFARNIQFQDERVEFEGMAGTLMEDI